MSYAVLEVILSARCDALEARTWKADKISSNTEPSALACSSANARRHDIQDGKDGSSHHAQSQDLIHGQAVTRNKQRSHGHKQTLHQIIYHTVKVFRGRVHSSIFIEDFFYNHCVFLSKGDVPSYTRNGN